MSEEDESKDKAVPDPQPVASKPAADASADASKAPARKLPPKAPPARNLLAFCALLVAVAALALSAWLYQQSLLEQDDSAQQELARQQQQLRADFGRLENDLRGQRDRLADRQADNHRETQSRLSDLEDRQRSLQRQLQTLSHSDRQDWLLAEAEYLLRLANQRLLMGRDLQGSAEMLRAADSILASLGDSGLNNVRAAIADEISALRTADRFDPEGLYFQIRAAANRAAELRLFDMPEFETLSQESDAEPAPSRRWLSGVSDALAKLGNYVRLEKRDEAFLPLISPVQESSLRYSLSMLFEQSQLALLAGNQTLYEHSLQRASDWIERYYVLDERAAEVVIFVEELRAEPVTVDTPDISTSLRRLKHYVETVHRPMQSSGDDA